MTISPGRDDERTFPSTTWHWKDGSLRRAARPEGQRGAKRSSIFALRSRDPRKRLDIQVSYLGGPEGTWLIEGRGLRWKFPGSLAFADVLAWVNRIDA